MVVPGTTVVDPKSVRDVGTDCRVLWSRRSPIHRHVDGDGLADGNTDAVADQRCKARQLERQLVRTGGDRREAVQAISCRSRRLDAHDGRTGQRHGDPRQHAALIVNDLTHQLAERLPRLRRGRYGTDGNDQRQRNGGSREHSCHGFRPPEMKPIGARGRPTGKSTSVGGDS
jgi:hypothetical protein